MVIEILRVDLTQSGALLLVKIKYPYGVRDRFQNIVF